MQNTSGPKNSVMFSPIMSKKSQRYEDVEAAYDHIVEQEELRRLKQNKIIAKRRKQRKKQMISRIENEDSKVEGDNTEDSSDANSSDFSDDVMDDDDYLDDLENSQVLNVLNGEERDDLDDDSCMID
jgi:predicted  nucleic acid-binding Zn-ribbon protein